MAKLDRAPFSMIQYCKITVCYVHIVFSGFVAILKVKCFCESGVIWFVMADPTCSQLLIMIVTILSVCGHFINRFTPLCSGLESKFRSFYERLVQNDYKITRRPLLHTNAWTFYLFLCRGSWFSEYSFSSYFILNLS